MSVNMNYSIFLNNKDRLVQYCDVTGSHYTEENTEHSFVEWVPVTSHRQICLSLLFEFMLYLTLNYNFLLVTVFMNTYFCKPSTMNIRFSFESSVMM